MGEIKESCALFLQGNKFPVECILKQHHNVPEENILSVLTVLEMKDFLLSIMKSRSQRENINKYDSENIQRGEVITLRFERQMTNSEG